MFYKTSDHAQIFHSDGMIERRTIVLSIIFPPRRAGAQAEQPLHLGKIAAPHCPA